MVTFLVVFRAPTYLNSPQNTREGALNIVRQAVDVGVKHVSFVGTVGAVIDLTDPLVRPPLSDEDRNPSTNAIVCLEFG